MMKRLFFVITLAFITVICINAQSRTETKEIAKIIEKSPKLTQAIGWEQNASSGKWIQNKNVIYNEACPSYLVSQVSQNMRWMQIVKFTYKDKEFYALMYEKLAGEYKYPNIREGWKSEKQTKFFVMTPRQYNEFKKQINLQSGKTIKVKSSCFGNHTDKYKSSGGLDLYTEENILIKLTNKMDDAIFASDNFKLSSQIVDGEEIIRFRLPEPNVMPDSYFKTQYFEVKTKNFRTLLID